MIEVNNIYKTYHTGSIKFLALDDVSLRVEKGEYTSIMGPSGSGKSTFMNIIGCLDTIDKGKYLLNGVDVSSLKPNELAHVRNKEIGFVFQSFNLLPALTILENVELTMTYAGYSVKERRVKALEALEKVGLINWIKHRPNEISGGQKQRVSIARAIVNNPSILLADEPTGNLDSKSSEDIIKIFQGLNDEGTTILMVTHEPEVAKFSKRIVRFFDGKIVSDDVSTNIKDNNSGNTEKNKKKKDNYEIDSLGNDDIKASGDKYFDELIKTKKKESNKSDKDKKDKKKEKKELKKMKKLLGGNDECTSLKI